MLSVRQPAVAGTFYSASKETLMAEVHAMLASAPKKMTSLHPKALIVPHAGYVYSGHVAAAAYAFLANVAASITRVILLGPAHRVAVNGLALPGCDAFATPLGNVPIDQDAFHAISTLKQVVINPAAHASEHSLEVQLPFMQIMLGAFRLLPLAVGNASAAEVAEVLDTLWGGPETLIIISSDLSHFLPYDEAKTIDRSSTEDILAMRPLRTHHQACGAIPINGLLLAAQRHHLHPHLIALCNSGDTAGDRSRVVGYASLCFSKE